MFTYIVQIKSIYIYVQCRHVYIIYINDIHVLDCFSIMLLAPIVTVVCPLCFAFQICLADCCFNNAFGTLCAWFRPHCATLLPIMKVVCTLGFASGAVILVAAVTFGSVP